MTHLPERQLPTEEYDTLDMTDSMMRNLKNGLMHLADGNIVASNNCFQIARRFINGDPEPYAKSLLKQAKYFLKEDQLLYAYHQYEKASAVLEEHDSLRAQRIKKVAILSLLRLDAEFEARAVDWPQPSN